MKPEFSIIVPTYNRGYILWKTLLSIQQQEMSDFEVLVIDDGSRDDTDKMMRIFERDHRFFYHKRPHHGVAAARQYGLDLARGKIITFVDSDDPVFKNYLKMAWYIFHHDPQVNFCLANCNYFVELVDHTNKILAKKHLVTHKTPVTLDNIYHWEKRIAIGTGMFFKHDHFAHQVKWCQDLSCLEDLDFFLQLARIDPKGYYFIIKPLFDYHQRYGFDSICSSISYQEWANAFAGVLNRHKDDPLLTRPQCYIEKIAKYIERDKLYEQGLYVPPHLKRFPEYYEALKEERVVA